MLRSSRLIRARLVCAFAPDTIPSDTTTLLAPDSAAIEVVEKRKCEKKREVNSQPVRS